jgi:2',3'-cyclic-nucleotide 2'-phosphodiesterase (5'-nucleotidase family)
LPQSKKEGLEAKAETILNIYNQFDCEVLNVGTNDMANGMAYLLALEGKAKFRFISANIADRKSGKLVFKPYEIINIAGRKIGVIGVTGGNPNVEEVQFLDVVESINGIVPELKKKTDLTILLANVGEMDLKKIAQQCEDIDFVVRSRSSQVLSTPQKTGKTRIIQMGYQGKYAGIVYVNMQDKGSYLRDLTPEHNQSSFVNERLERLLEKVPENMEPEDYYKETPSRLDLLKSLKKELIEKAQTIEKTDNYLWFAKIALDKTIEDDTAILEQIKPLEKKYGYK